MVILIHKNGSTEMNNYCPISMLSIFGPIGVVVSTSVLHSADRIRIPFGAVKFNIANLYIKRAFWQ